MLSNRTRWLLAQAKAHAPWRALWPNRAVRRDVQGVDLWMPWSHLLPDYARYAPSYGQNLVELAVRLVEPGKDELTMIDVGANIGDSILQIRTRIDVRALAVEPDPQYLSFLERNVGADRRVQIAPVLLTAKPSAERFWEPSRRGGTTHFVANSARNGIETLSVQELAESFDSFVSPRLIKSDTDGHDTSLVPEMAKRFGSLRPVLFFEYDPTLTRRVVGRDASDVWNELLALGYERVAVWDNFGRPLALSDCRLVNDVARSLLQPARGRQAADYLDVAVVHHEDAAGNAALEDLWSDRTTMS